MRDDQSPTITQQVTDAAAEAQATRADGAEFQRLMKFVQEVREKGLIIQRTYDLPLPDTIGRGWYRGRTNRRER